MRVDVVACLLRSLNGKIVSCHTAGGQGGIRFHPVLEITSSGFEQ